MGISLEGMYLQMTAFNAAIVFVIIAVIINVEKNTNIFRILRRK
jgi:hypothetical protein